MKTLLAFLILPALLPAAAADFNGRWNITVERAPKPQAWWLEVTGAGTPAIKGRFVGAPGGNMDDIPAISITDGELRFVFERGKEANLWRGIYTARLLDSGELRGAFDVEGKPAAHLDWTGRRAPVIRDRDDGSWYPSTPIALFNGKDMEGWRPMIPGTPLGWTVKDGLLTNVAHANNLVSAANYWNFKLRVEFRLAAKSNSGIGLRGRYEVQILDDFGKPPGTHGTGALYSRILPRVNAARPAGEWQTYEITLIGRTVTVIVNGVNVIDKGEVEGLTAIAHDPDEASPGPISLQGDHGPVEIRSIVLTPLTHTAPSARLLFRDTFDRKTFTNWGELGINNPGDPLRDVQRSEWGKVERVKLVQSPLSQPGKMAVQFTVPHTSGDFRSELALKHETGYQERWYAARIFVPLDWTFDPNPGNDIVMQWHAVLGEAKQTPGQRNFPPVSIAIQNDRWVVTNNFGALSDIQRVNFAVAEGVERGRWTSWVVHVRWSPTTDGLLEVWKDGVQVVHKSGQNTYVTSNPHSPYFKIGIYHPTWNLKHGDPTAKEKVKIERKVVLIDEVRVGDAHASYADVAPCVGSSTCVDPGTRAPDTH